MWKEAVVAWRAIIFVLLGGCREQDGGRRQTKPCARDLPNAASTKTTTTSTQVRLSTQSPPPASHFCSFLHCSRVLQHVLHPRATNRRNADVRAAQDANVRLPRYARSLAETELIRRNTAFALNSVIALKITFLAKYEAGFSSLATRHVWWRHVRGMAVVVRAHACVCLASGDGEWLMRTE